MTSAFVIPLPCHNIGSNASGNYFQPIGRTFRNNGRVTDAELRQAVARNVQARMDADPDLKSSVKLAARSGVSKSAINYVLAADNDCTIATIAGLARAFRCQPWELMVADEDDRAAGWRRLMVR
jgi:hypothetical protein